MAQAISRMTWSSFFKRQEDEYVLFLHRYLTLQRRGCFMKKQKLMEREYEEDVDLLQD